MPKTLNQAVSILYDAFSADNLGGFYTNLDKANEVAEILNVTAIYLGKSERWSIQPEASAGTIKYNLVRS